jgi:hypothetical protein
MANISPGSSAQFSTSLQKKAEYYMDCSLAKSTRRTYASAWGMFLRFVALYGVNNILQAHDSVRERSIVAFVIFCADQLKLSHSSISSYLCAIKYYFTRYSGIQDALSFDNGVPFSQLHLVLKGIRKTNSFTRSKRVPVTIDVLNTMIHVLAKGWFGPYLDTMFKAIFLMAFFGFMRCGEFTSPNDNFCFKSGLALLDIQLQSTSLNITLRRSKTDPCGKGVIIQLFPQGNDLCPIRAVQDYLKLRSTVDNHPKAPFFLMPSLKPLTRSDFVTHLQSVLQCIGRAGDNIQPHSFRIGAATTAAAAKVPDHVIKILGRWSSDTYQRYIRTSHSVISAAQQSMATHKQ